MPTLADLNKNAVVLLCIIVFTGIFSGITSYAWRDTKVSNRRWGWVKYVLMATLAAATTPLFLQTISSELIQQTPNSPYAKPVNYLIFAGLCLLAGFSAPQYVKKLSATVFKELEDSVKESADTAKTALDEAKEAKELANASIDPKSVEPATDPESEPSA